MQRLAAFVVFGWPWVVNRAFWVAIAVRFNH